MRTTKVLAVFLVFFLTALASVTQANERYCATSDTQETRIYFVNGVWNTRYQAAFSLGKIRVAYRQYLEERYPNQSFVFHVAYNYSFDKVQDLVEVIAQKEEEIGGVLAGLTPRQYLTLYMSALKGEDLPYELPPALDVPVVDVAIEDYLAALFTEAINAQEITQRFRNDLMEGARLVVFAHSQGNLFAGEAVTALLNNYTNNIAMIGVASPARNIPSGSMYVTAHDDRVINRLRADYDVLPSNVDNDLGVFDDHRDLSNHEFVASYFAGELPSRTMIDNAFYAMLRALQFPARVANSGIITVTLTWGAQPDVDLHVFEPNGMHVYYSDKRGVSGYLDVDDIFSYGPEHYYVSCDTLEVGTYSVGVNYFRGYSPEQALVQINAGNQGRSFVVSLESARGRAGDSNPIPVVDIVVSGDSASGFSFAIENKVPEARAQ